MSSLFFKISTTVLLIVVIFVYVIIFKLQTSSEHERYIKYAANLKNNSGLSLSTSPYYKSNDFYLGIKKDNYMSFAYAE